MSQLGCAENYYVDIAGNLPLDRLVISKMQFDRRLDDVSYAKIEIPIAGSPNEACCGSLRYLEPWMFELRIKRDETNVWSGPISRIRYGRGSVILEAYDKAIWYQMRVMHENHVNENDDLSDIFQEYHDDLMSVGDVGFSVSATPTGIRTDRTVNRFDRSEGWFEIRKLLQEGLDMTVLGNTVYIGGQDISSSAQITLTGADFVNDIELVKDGNAQAEKVYVKASNDIIGEYPEEGTVIQSPGGLIERVFSHSNVDSDVAADELARTRWEHRNIAPRYLSMPAGGQLSPKAPVSINQLIPGRMIWVEVDDLCYPTQNTYRLAQVDVSFGARGVKDEMVKLTLEPLGTQ